MNIRKPCREDVSGIRAILEQWTEKEEVVKYIERIENEINGEIEFNMRFWVMEDQGEVVGVSGIGDPYPKLAKFAKTAHPGLLKIMYLDNRARGKGLGKVFLKSMEKEAARNGYTEVILGSSSRYKDTAYGFYEKMGYEVLGRINGTSENDFMEVFGMLLR